MASEMSPEYLETLRRMTGQRKLKTAFGMYHSARKLKACAVRQKHPDWSEEKVQQKVTEIFLHASH